MPYCIQAIKDLDVIVQGLKDKINNLEADNTILEARVHELEMYSIYIMSYMLLIFHDTDCSISNSFIKFNTMKDIIKWSNDLIKYSDSKKKTRVYKTAKSFVRIFKDESGYEGLYFKYKYRDLRYV